MLTLHPPTPLTAAVLEKPLEKKSGRIFGPPGTKRLIYFIDDMNMPEVDKYGTVAPHTLIRQHLDHGHWWVLDGHGMMGGTCRHAWGKCHSAFPAQVRQEQADPEGHSQLPVRGLHEPHRRLLHHRLTAAGVQGQGSAWHLHFPGTKPRGWNDPAVPVGCISPLWGKGLIPISAPLCSGTSVSWQ